jgi:hypothetical protein
MKQLTIILLTSVILFGCNGQTKTDNPATVTEISVKTSSLTEEEIKRLDSVNIDFQFRGDCYAYSSNKNAEPSGGEAHSDNLPKKVNQSFPKNGLYLTINQNEFSRIDSTFLGYKLYLVNTTDSVVTLDASDSRLDVIAEALNSKNEWSPISYLPSSWCGNSYHTVKLDKDEYWSFDIPVFKGKIKTKMRYVLLLDKDNKIISNEVVVQLNSGQFDKEKKQGHQGYNIMDPYND